MQLGKQARSRKSVTAKTRFARAVFIARGRANKKTAKARM